MSLEKARQCSCINNRNVDSCYYQVVWDEDQVKQFIEQNKSESLYNNEHNDQYVVKIAVMTDKLIQIDLDTKDPDQHLQTRRILTEVNIRPNYCQYYRNP